MTPTTISAPGGFTENFTTAAGFYDRFDYGLSGFHPTVDPNHTQMWEGDHNMACEGAATSRTVHLGPDKDHLGELFWWCAPAGPDTGHVMTSLTAQGYVYLWFAPKPYFANVSKVCWDQNTTMLGGRSWTGVSVSSRSEVERVIAEQGRLELGFSHPGEPDTGVLPTWNQATKTGTYGIWEFAQLIHTFRGRETLAEVGFFEKHEDVATRFRHCMTDNGNDTITFTQQRFGGSTHTQTIAGSFPDGEVRVSFVTANYNPQKDDEYDPGQNTWHWDNITIETES